MLLERTIELVKTVQNKFSGLQIAFDNDTNHSEHFQTLEKLHELKISKLAVVNHALKGIDRDWKTAKNKVMALKNQDVAKTLGKNKKPSSKASNVFEYCKLCVRKEIDRKESHCESGHILYETCTGCFRSHFFQN